MKDLLNVKVDVKNFINSDASNQEKIHNYIGISINVHDKKTAKMVHFKWLFAIIEVMKLLKCVLVTPIE